MVLAVQGCLFSSDSGGSSTVIKFGDGPTDIDLSQTDDATYTYSNGVLTLVEEDISCRDSGVVKVEDYTSTKKLLIQNDSLYIWEDGECEAEVYSGSSSNLEGVRWRREGYVLAPDADTYCGPEDIRNDWKGNEGLDMFITYSGGKITYITTGKYCYTDLFDEGSGGTAVDCNTWTEDTEAGVITYTMKSLSTEGGGGVKTATFNGTTCTLNQPDYVETTAATCAAAWTAYQNDPDASPYFNSWNYENAEGDAANAAFDNCLIEAGVPESDL